MSVSQEHFNQVWNGFEAQGWSYSTIRSATGAVGCAYRGANGTKCAIGHIMPDDIAERAGTTGVQYLANDDLAACGITHGNIDSYRALQRVHDYAALSKLRNAEFKANMRAFARKHNLSIPGE